MQQSVDELFKSNLVLLPVTAPKDEPYHRHLRDLFANYVHAVQDLRSTDAVTAAVQESIPRITSLADHLVATHTATLAGEHDKAWDHLQRAVNAVMEDLMLLQSKEMMNDDIGPLFRVRGGPIAGSFQRNDLFHIPFQSRHAVSPQRYSTSGIPMLYLGSSLYVCWEEMGRPDFSTLWVSALRLREDEKARLLNLGWRPGVVAHFLSAANHNPEGELCEIAVALATLWPLQAACSHRRRYPDARFVEEYIIPQMLTRFVVESGEFEGIRFFSCRVRSRGSNLHKEAMNFVFPAVPLADRGYSTRLLKKLEMTPPMPWTLVLPMGPRVSRGDPSVRSGIGVTEIVRGHPIDYSRTDFARIEGHLMDQSYLPLN